MKHTNSLPTTKEDFELTGTTTINNSQSPLIKRTPSYLTANRSLYTRHPSIELLNPTHSSLLRKSPAHVAIFNLVATICGGGVLSLPLAFSVAGIVPSTIMLLFAAGITDFSLYILCCCARRTGGTSYGDIARIAFGNGAEVVTSAILFLLLVFVLVAFMVLAKDFWTPIVLFLVPGFEEFLGGGEKGVDDVSVDDMAGPYVLFVILVVIAPLFLKRDLHALRHTCYVGFCSLVVLSGALFYRCREVNREHPELFKTKVLWFAESYSEWIYAFPIISLSFFCSYNVLSVHGSLVNPTRKRTKAVLDTVVLMCFVFFFIFGICGYLYAYNDTKDNIILNFQLSDNVIIFGRIGYAATIMFGMPLILLPARETLLSMPDQFVNWFPSNYSAHTAPTASSTPKPHIVNGINFDEERPLLRKMESIDTYNAGLVTPKVKPKTAPRVTLDDQRNVGLRPPTRMEYILHVSSTFGIVIVCYIGAVAVPGVAAVWSVSGSSMAIIIAFFIPAACYLKIRARKGWNSRSIGAMGLLIFSVVSSVVCTIQSISKLMS